MANHGWFSSIFTGHVEGDNPHDVARELTESGLNVNGVSSHQVGENDTIVGGDIEVWGNECLTDDEEKALHNHGVKHARRTWFGG